MLKIRRKVTALQSDQGYFQATAGEYFNSYEVLFRTCREIHKKNGKFQKITSALALSLDRYPARSLHLAKW